MSKNHSTIKKTNDTFIEELLNKNEYYKNGEFFIVDDYINARTHLNIITKYGLCTNTPDSLLRGTNPTCPRSAVDLSDYLVQYVESNNEYLMSGYFKILTIPKSIKGLVLTETPYGICKCTVGNLMIGAKPSIVSAINKTSYWINYAKEVNTKCHNYTFEKVNFLNNYTNITVTCKKHGDFQIRPANFIGKNQGCQKCLDRKKSNINNGGWTTTSWILRANKSENFDSYKVYILRCWDENEEFYKIGKTFTTIKKRFPSKAYMPYKFEVIKIIEDLDGIKISELEHKFKNICKDFRYFPKNHFFGHKECFSTIKNMLNSLVD